MGEKRKPDFSGYASKANLKCTDGKTILAHAFKNDDGKKFPLVWNHMYDSPDNVLGHALVEDREDGTYIYGFLNDGDQAKAAGRALEHGDFDAMSIFANNLVMRGDEVVHGRLREVSLTLAGANPEAKVDFVSIRHSDGSNVVSDEDAIITSGLTLEHADLPDPDSENEDSKDDDEDAETLEDIIDTFDEKQLKAFQAVVTQALETEPPKENSEDENDSEDKTNKTPAPKEQVKHSKEGTPVPTRNVFEVQTEKDGEVKNVTIKHSDLLNIIEEAQQPGQTLRSALKHADEKFGIGNIDLLFPEAKAIRDTPDWVKRDTEWVNRVVDGASKRPFARIKSLSADLTQDEARARGYIKGNLKKEEFFELKSRSTGPGWIYKKQKLDREDMINAQTIDVINWLRGEMRMMLVEELGRAILVGDGRPSDSEDKIKDPKGANTGDGIRSIANDDPFYAHPIEVDLNADPLDIIDKFVEDRSNYKGTGLPILFTTESFITKLLLIRDTNKRRLYKNVEELASELRVSAMIPVEILEGGSVLGIAYNPTDYVIGTDKGGELTSFEQFDIDYNQQKFLIETYLSGALTMPKSALVLKAKAAAPTPPIGG